MAKGLKKGIFITLEGTEGSGKSTQSRMLTSFLKKKGFKALHIWDPGSTQAGEAVRNILLSPGKEVSAVAETMLYMAARAQLVDEKIMPALKKKTIVICDRFLDATVCYQGYGLGVNIKLIDSLNKFVTKSRKPDITFYLDADIKKGLRRSHNVKGFSDRIERRSYNFHCKVRNGYLALARKFPRRIKKISIEENDKNKTQLIIREKILAIINKTSQ